MKIVIISPYHGGSHKAWAEGYQHHSEHKVNLLALSDQFWKWRMHGGAVTLAQQFMTGSFEPDLIAVTDMLDLTTFLSLTREKTSSIPTVLYMHENQLTYPLPKDGSTGPMRRQMGERDRHYAFINYVSMMTAVSIQFNSKHHQNSWFAALPNFLKHYPDNNELETIELLEAKSAVLPVGVDFKRLAIGDWRLEQSQSPLILWNQRWEYDKNPEAFFKALLVMKKEGIPFRLALCGQEYGKRPSPIQTAIDQLSDHVIHVGYANRELYNKLLWEADITISTAHHEFFGISILEAIYCQTFPILPNRLSYPELIPTEQHDSCLYNNEADCIDKLRWALTHPHEAKRIAQRLATQIGKYDWTEVTQQYDAVFTNIIEANHV